MEETVKIMLKNTIVLLLFGIGILFSAAESYGQKIVTAAQVNGSWKEVSGKFPGTTSEFKIWSLGGQKLKVEFFGNNAAREISNTATGIVSIDGTTATFKPADNQIDSENPCVITLKFTAGKLIVSEKGECGWGRGIGSEGTYKKISSKKPQFDEQ
jgi:hypothetical protein